MRRLLRLLAMTVLVGCAAGAPQPKPEDFPLHARDQVFVLDYRIDHHPDRIEAVGLITSRTTETFRFARVDLWSDGGRPGRAAAPIWNGTWGPVSFTVSSRRTERSMRKLQVGNYFSGWM
jgi:hypothetical protein